MARALALVVLLAVPVACGGGDGGGDDDDDSGIDAGERGDAPPGGGWSGLSPLGGGAVQEIGVAGIDGVVYVVGGFHGARGLVDEVWAYDVAGDAWSEVASLPVPAHHANVAAVDGKLYVLGSLSDIGFTASGASWVYDPVADAWNDVEPMPAGTERGGAGVAVMDGLVYVLGGFRGAAVADVSAYDPVMNTWDPTLPDLPAPRDHLVAGAVDGVVYAVGGRAGAIDGRVDTWSAGETSWGSAAPMRTPRAGCGADVVNGMIVVVGGEGNSADPDGVFHETEIYDPVADAWIGGDDMLTPRHGMGAATVNGALYVPGGATVQGFGATDANEVYFAPESL